MQKMGRKNKEVGKMPTCCCLTLICCQPCLPNFQCFKVVYHEHLFAFSPSAMSVMPKSQERILEWMHLRLDQKCLSRLAVYDEVIRGAPILVLPRAPQP